VRRRLLSGVAILALVAIVLGFGKSKARPDTAARGWAWSRDVPGRVTGRDPLTSTMAQRSAVDVSTLRELVSAGSGLSVLSLEVGAGPAGRLYVAEHGTGFAGQFAPFDSLTARNPALVPFVSVSGPGPDSVTGATLVGVARADVKRVDVTLASSSMMTLPLNRWRAFGYAATTPEALPVTVSAYRADGTKISETALNVRP
jgi:hypothetical protein